MVRELQSRLQEARATEGLLPAQIDVLQQRLQREFTQLQSREAGVRYRILAGQMVVKYQVAARLQHELPQHRLCCHESVCAQAGLAFLSQLADGYLHMGAALAAATTAQQADLATLQEAVKCYSLRLGLRLESAQGERPTCCSQLPTCAACIGIGLPTLLAFVTALYVFGDGTLYRIPRP